jgi:hypothetical protein
MPIRHSQAKTGVIAPPTSTGQVNLRPGMQTRRDRASAGEQAAGRTNTGRWVTIQSKGFIRHIAEDCPGDGPTLQGRVPKRHATETAILPRNRRNKQ